MTVSIAGILTALALPALRSIMQNDRLWNEQNTLVMSLNAARSEAIKQNASVKVCPSSDGATCNNPGTWTTGWIVVLVSSATPPPTPIQSIPTLSAHNTLTEANSLTAVTFQSTGMVQAAAGFKFCDSRGASQARYTKVTASGQVLSAPVVGKDLGGTALTCP